MANLETQFNQAMKALYDRALSEANYKGTGFLTLLYDLRGVGTAKYLINKAEPSDGYTNLYDRRRLDLTVEALVVEEAKWHPLFEEEEIAKAKRRLRQFDYTPRPRA